MWASLRVAVGGCYKAYRRGSVFSRLSLVILSLFEILKQSGYQSCNVL